MKKYFLWLLLLISLSYSCFAQYQDSIIEGVNWSGITHTTAWPGKIISPSNSAQTVSIQDTAKVEFISAREVSLKDGFWSGAFSNNGFFHAHNGPTMNTNDIILISPDTTASGSDTVHINKWEKYEIAFKLPPEYNNAITTFFSDNYQEGSPDTAHDLNPY